MIAKKCAYWVSLRSASKNTSSHTVYLPRRNLLSPDNLLDLMTRLSRREEVNYAP